MKRDPLFKFVAVAILAALIVAGYTATHSQTQVLFRDAIVTTSQGSSQAP